jgi:hypothetical protein
MNQPLLMAYIFDFFFLAGSILLTYFGYKLFKYGIHDEKQKFDKRTFFSGIGPGLLFMFFGGFMLLFSILTLDSERKNKYTPSGNLQFSESRDDAIFGYVRKNQEDIRMLRNELSRSNSLIEKLSNNINNFEEIHNRQFYTFKNDIDSSRKIMDELNRNFKTFHFFKDTFLDKKNSYSKIDKYLNEQDNILSKAVKMLEIINNRQNILERAVVRLHQEELGKDSNSYD